MRNIILIGMAREKSRRTKNKMTRLFDDTCLYDIYLKKLERISKIRNPFSKIAIVICRNDAVLWNMSKNSEISTVARSAHSISDNIKGIAEAHHYLDGFDEEYVMFVNGCFPFLKIETIMEAADFFKKQKEIRSLTCARYRHNYFWDAETHEPINNKDKQNIHTGSCPPLLESVQCFHICNRKALLENDYLWDFTENNPYLYIVSEGAETLDIDTEFEFEICEALWRKRNEK